MSRSYRCTSVWKKMSKQKMQIVSELKNVFALVSDDNQRSYSLKLIKDSGLNKW